MLQDLKPEDLRSSISTDLGIKYLSPVGVAASDSLVINGLVYGYNHRVIVTAAVQCFDLDNIKCDPLYVHFILDTASPYTYISPEAVNALTKRNPGQSDRFRAIINGITLPVVQTPDHDAAPGRPECHFRGLNVLGTDFMNKGRAILEVDFSNLLVKLQLT